MPSMFAGHVRTVGKRFSSGVSSKLPTGSKAMPEYVPKAMKRQIKPARSRHNTSRRPTQARNSNATLGAASIHRIFERTNRIVPVTKPQPAV
jgi:hypothetical protein